MITGQFTISFHWYELCDVRNHIDIFLFFPNATDLIHYSSARAGLKLTSTFTAQKGKTHRLKYLHYSGRISGNRGRVRIISRGKFTCSKNFIDKLPQTVKFRVSPNFKRQSF
ncbi:MAG: hypothetical protein KDK38_02465 [Leptospiraceae bacterium]|nr:hypothetical protein [Leptospiraceae bacterium]